MMDAFLQIKSDCLKPCASAFRLNLIRTVNFALLPAELCSQSRRDAYFQSNAVFEATGKGHISLSEMLDPPAVSEKAVQYFLQQAADFEALEFQERVRFTYMYGVLVAETFAKSNPMMSSSMEALLTSIVLESWLFFEAFASDLWVAGVDNGGAEIMGRIHSCDKWEKSEENIKAHQGIAINANAKTQPGSYLREIGKVSFQKLRSIRYYFGVAFGNTAQKLLEETSGGFIDALNAVRNCMAHSAGKVDGAFKRNAVDRFPEFSHLKINDPILLDGILVKKLRNTSAEVAFAILKHVDEILIAGG